MAIAWREIERHPLSAEYEDIAGSAWKQFVENVKTNGVVDGRKIITYEGMVLDGWQLLRACRIVGIEPQFEELPGEYEAERYVITVNDLRRQTESPETVKRRAERRRERVAKQRSEGKSTRTIAEEEGVSKTTIDRDLEKIAERSGGPGGHLNGGEDQGDAYEGPLPPVKVTGKDGKKYAPSVKVMCLRCQRVGQVKDCPKCSETRKKSGVGATGRKPKTKKQKTTRAILKDALGTLLPDNCRDAFADESLPKLTDEIEQVANLATAENWLHRAQKLCPTFSYLLIEKFKDHVYNALEGLQLARDILNNAKPYAVCPKCEAVEPKRTGCRGCRGNGFVPEHRHTELVS